MKHTLHLGPKLFYTSTLAKLLNASHMFSHIKSQEGTYDVVIVWFFPLLECYFLIAFNTLILSHVLIRCMLVFKANKIFVQAVNNFKSFSSSFSLTASLFFFLYKLSAALVTILILL